jgi:ATP synthase protein I
MPEQDITPKENGQEETGSRGVSKDDLDARIRAASARHIPEPTSDEGGSPASGGLGMGLRIGVEVVSALVVGTLIGLALDRWLGTAPWFVILFFLLGSGAGVMNVYRIVNGLGYAVGLQAPSSKGDSNGNKKS